MVLGLGFQLLGRVSLPLVQGLRKSPLKGPEPPFMISDEGVTFVPRISRQVCYFGSSLA